MQNAALTQAEVFWQNPPWQGGKSKYRLGLAPIEITHWFPIPMTNDVIAHKTQLLKDCYDQVVAVADIAQAGIAAQQALASRRPKTQAHYPDLVANLAMQVPDDLCLMQTNAPQRLVAACVCSPSYWDVRTKIGRPLREIHQPVESMNEKIGDPIERFISNAPLMKPFERTNWFIHDDTQRFHNEPDDTMKNGPTQWYVRSERETLCRVHEDYLLFTINPRFQPLADIAQYPQAQQDLLIAMAGFDEDEIDYFGGEQKCLQIRDYIETMR
ncbi:MAG: DUF3445 domain-containing protein [Pseudomonadales bacterium]|nr:DUF3445 domain-containing protein [Pseudomonadales bacterium]